MVIKDTTPSGKKVTEKRGEDEPVAQGPWHLPARPWTTIQGGMDGDTEERSRWRVALEPCIQALSEDKAHRAPINGMTNPRLIYGLARAVTLSHPSNTGRIDKIPATMGWACPNTADQNAYLRTQASSEDRAELLRWLGGGTARVNWRSKGAGAAPMTVGAVAELMTHWCAIAWRGRPVPDWCQKEVAAVERVVYPKNETLGLYRLWAVARVDMNVFLRAWTETRSALGRYRPRAGVHPKQCDPAAIHTMNRLLLMRALEMTYPGSIGEETMAMLKNLGNVIGAPSALTTMEPLVRAMEDRRYLESGLETIPNHPMAPEPTSRRRKL